MYLSIYLFIYMWICVCGTLLSMILLPASLDGSGGKGSTVHSRAFLGRSPRAGSTGEPSHPLWNQDIDDSSDFSWKNVTETTSATPSKLEAVYTCLKKRFGHEASKS